MSLRSPGVRRLMQEAKELSEPTEMYVARPLEDNLFEWHFTIRGPPDSSFEGGIYHGRIILPNDYPHKPPSFILLTPNGRFETNTKICLSISSYHPETWLPSWSISTALVALIAFMTTPGQGAIGALDCSDQQRKKLAKDSLKWCCSTCGCKMHEVGEELKAQIGKKECAKLPPINPDAGKGDADSNSSIASSSVSTVPEQPEVKSTPIVKPTLEKSTEPSIQPPVPQPITHNSIPQPPLVANVPVQQEVNSQTFAFLIFFFLAIFLGLAYRRLIYIQG